AYSPISLGSAILGIFGLIAFISFLDALLGSPERRALHGPGNPIGKLLSIVGAIAGLALAGYTGVLLNVTNLPVWQDSPWISALFGGMRSAVPLASVLALVGGFVLRWALLAAPQGIGL